MCHADDSVILGSWLQETDHKAIEDQVGYVTVMSLTCHVMVMSLSCYVTVMSLLCPCCVT